METHYKTKHKIRQQVLTLCQEFLSSRPGEWFSAVDIQKFLKGKLPPLVKAMSIGKVISGASHIFQRKLVCRTVTCKKPQLFLYSIKPEGQVSQPVSPALVPPVARWSDPPVSTTPIWNEFDHIDVTPSLWHMCDELDHLIGRLYLTYPDNADNAVWFVNQKHLKRLDKDKD